MGTIRLIIAEDHDLVREGLRLAFETTEIEVVGEAATGRDAIRLALEDLADVMLLDISMPDGDGFDVLREVKSARPRLAVLVYSQHERCDFQCRARELGAGGYLVKRAGVDELLGAVRRVSQGEAWVQV